MFGVEVYGVKASGRTSIGAAIQTISQSDHRQLFADTAKPAINGPRADQPHAENTHQDNWYGTYKREYTFENVAPALARAGLPKNP
jgi:hypothetical protein